MRDYEILLDPTDRFLVWDMAGDAPVILDGRIATFPEMAQTRLFVSGLRFHLVSEHVGGHAKVEGACHVDVR